MDSSKDMIEIAARFINSTQEHIFLTGKAGTGKTTFLRDLAQRTYKRFVIVAPTGIAALNAQGVTIHSQFQLPFGSFIPDASAQFDLNAQSHFYTGRSLSYKSHLSAVKRQVLRSIDLLIIDEVSMLRADILDAIDYRLRRVKARPNEAFGGVQLLMIGDLYQLPPVVKESEKKVMRQYYPSMHFFEAKALKESGMVYLELDKIFRQSDSHFISILNNLRDGKVTSDDLEVLNAHYKSEEEIREMEEVIQLTTHNHKAERINEEELRALKGKEVSFDAHVADDFPEKLFPLNAELKLKEGAQVMFIKNDRSGAGRYYNGKLAQVVSLDDGEIEVELADSDERIILEEELWENKRYELDEESKELEEEVIGTFKQYPIKLAWAVTVHKSQGLTFDKAVIDVSDAFAPGQVYVALSRLRSLDGLILSKKMLAQSLSTDPQVVEYTQTRAVSEDLHQRLDQGQEAYLRSLLEHSFDLQPIIWQAEGIGKGKSEKMEFEDVEMRSALEKLLTALNAEKENTRKYKQQLLHLLASGERERLLERLKKGRAYYLDFLKERLRDVLIHQSHVEQFSRTKSYLKALEDLDQSLLRKRQQIEQVSKLCEGILNGQMMEKQDLGEGQSAKLRLELLEAARREAELHPKRAEGKSGRKRKKPKGEKMPKGETYRITYAMLEKGKDIAAVAQERGLARSTVEGHVARGIGEGKLALKDFLEEEQVKEIITQMKKHNDSGVIHNALGGRYSYAQIRMVQADIGREDK